LHPKEGLTMVNGTAVGFSLASTVLFEAIILVVFTEGIIVLCEVMNDKPEYRARRVHIPFDSQVEAPPGADRGRGHSHHGSNPRGPLLKKVDFWLAEQLICHVMKCIALHI
jgi:hypothetical protein